MLNPLKDYKFKNICKKSLLKLGYLHNIYVAIEEASEFQKTLTKLLRNKERYLEIILTDKLTEEMADLLMMIEQIRIMKHIKEDTLYEMLEKKINKYKEQLDGIID